jgi:hypothetical protein
MTQADKGMGGEPVDEFIASIERLASQYGMAFDAQASNEPAAKRLSYFPILLDRLLPDSAFGHLLEQGTSPSNFYPSLFDAYLDTTRGEFEPEELYFDSDDDWESLLIRFIFGGSEYEIRVEDVNDSDWFSSDFVVALNRFAEAHLSGRWVDFYDSCDWCTSVYVPAGAYGEFRALSDQLEKLLESQPQ